MHPLETTPNTSPAITFLIDGSGLGAALLILFALYTILMILSGGGQSESS